MKTFKQFIYEGKQVGLLYHFTNNESLNKILDENKMIGSFMYEENGKDIYGVSTTRNKNLNYDFKKNNIRITLDGDKLSNNYKIKPKDYWYRQYNIPFNPQTVDEDEETILTPKGYIYNIKNYIISIDNIKNQNYINENSNNDKIIYHFTENIDSLLSILDSNSLQSGSFNGRFGRGYENISFTWNPNLWDIEYVGDIEERYKIRISFDYTKMSKKWEFKPFDYGIPEEQEEIVEEEEMYGILEYITEILISSKESKKEVQNLKIRYPKLNIKIVKRK
jgi:hypothetical protein